MMGAKLRSLTNGGSVSRDSSPPSERQLWRRPEGECVDEHLGLLQEGCRLTIRAGEGQDIACRSHERDILDETDPCPGVVIEEIIAPRGVCAQGVRLDTRCRKPVALMLAPDRRDGRRRVLIERLCARHRLRCDICTTAWSNRDGDDDDARDRRLLHGPSGGNAE